MNHPITLRTALLPIPGVHLMTHKESIMFKKIVSTLYIALVGLSFTTTTLTADAAKGQKIILKKLKKPCGLNGAQLAVKHTQAEWKAIQEKKGLQDELNTICPKLKKPLKEKYIIHVYDFLYNYASDSGNVPSC